MFRLIKPSDIPCAIKTSHKNTLNNIISQHAHFTGSHALRVKKCLNKTSSSETTTLNISQSLFSKKPSDHLKESQTLLQETKEFEISVRMREIVTNALSKLFPGGAGWQLFSQLTNYAPDTFGFALKTGIGDALGVAGGCYFFSSVKYGVVVFANQYFDTKWVVPGRKEGISTSILLGTASLGSGTVWQPTVNALNALLPNLYTTSLGTGLVCGGTFFIGLQASRLFYPAALGIEKPNKDNRFSDFLLAMTGISGAAAAFVFTDTSEENPLKNIIGTDKSFLENVFRAGVSTATGFFLLQTLVAMITTKKCPPLKRIASPGNKNPFLLFSRSKKHIVHDVQQTHAHFSQRKTP